MQITKKEIGEIVQIFKTDANEMIFVLRAELFIENIIEKIIKAKFPEHKYILGKNGFQFFDKLRLIKAMGILPKGVYPAILALMELRNKFQLNYSAA